MNIKTRIRFVFEYLAVISMSILLYLFVDGDIGMLFILVLLILPVFSAICAITSKKPLKIAVSVSDNILEKGDFANITVKAEKLKATAPPLVCFDIFAEGSLGEYKETIMLPMFLKQKSQIEFSLPVKYCGGGKIHIENIFVSGMFGILRLKTNSQISETEISVYPTVQEIPPNNPVLTEISETSSFDDSEETNDNKMAFSGVPGYDHREYVEGDSLKRINWKLSAKRKKLFVRLDEAISKSKVSLVLSPSAIINYENADILLEGLLALCEKLSELENRCIFHYMKSGEWLSEAIETHDDTTNLRTILSSYSFSDKTDELIPFSEIGSQKATAMIVFLSPVFGEKEETALCECEKRGYKTTSITTRLEAISERKTFILSRSDGVINLE